MRRRLGCATGEFRLDLIGFDATELERLLGLADSEAGSDDAEGQSRARRESDHKWLLGSHGYCALTPQCRPRSSALDCQLADMASCNPPENVDLDDDLGGGLAGASALDPHAQ